MKQNIMTMVLPNGISITVDFDREALENPTLTVTTPTIEMGGGDHKANSPDWNQDIVDSTVKSFGPEEVILPEIERVKDPLGFETKDIVKELNDITDMNAMQARKRKFMLSQKKYPYEELLVGDHYEIQAPYASNGMKSVQSAFSSYGKKTGKKFAFRKEGVSLRMYRIS